MNIIEQLEIEEMNKIASNVPDFSSGDTLKVNVKVKEGNKERIQAYQGVCIARKNRGINSSFTVRKISYNVGVERVFPLYSPRISIEVMKRGVMRQAKPYYLRELSSKKARIAEKIVSKKVAKQETEKVQVAAKLVQEKAPQQPKKEAAQSKTAAKKTEKKAKTEN